MTALSIILSLIVWVGFGILTLRVLTYFHEGPDESDENFFLWMAVIAGPLFTASAIILMFFLLIAWLVNHSVIPKVLRKAAGFNG